MWVKVRWGTGSYTVSKYFHIKHLLNYKGKRATLQWRLPGNTIVIEWSVYSTSKGANQHHVPTNWNAMIKKKKYSITPVILLPWMAYADHEETFEKLKLRDSLQSDRSVTLKYVKDVKLRGRLRHCSRLKEPRET